MPEGLAEVHPCPTSQLYGPLALPNGECCRRHALLCPQWAANQQQQPHVEQVHTGKQQWCEQEHVPGSTFYLHELLFVLCRGEGGTFLHGRGNLCDSPIAGVSCSPWHQVCREPLHEMFP